MKTILEAKVEAKNRLYVAYNNLVSACIAAFTPFVGQKVMKADGLMKKFADLVPKAPSPDFHVYLNRSNYTLGWIINIDVTYFFRNGDQRSHRDEICLYIGDLKNGVLTKTLDFKPLEYGFSVEKILVARERFNKAKKEFDAAKSALGSFGEYDCQ